MAKSLFIKRITPGHEAIMDWEILNPGGTMRRCADELNLDEGHISVVRNSDAFIDYRSRRLAAHHANVSDSTIDKLDGLAKLTLDVMTERVEEERKTIAVESVRDTCSMALKALGFGNPAPSGGAPGSPVTIFVGASPEQLARAREKMRSVNTIENEPQVEEGPPVLTPVPAT